MVALYVTNRLITQESRVLGLSRVAKVRINIYSGIDRTVMDQREIGSNVEMG